MALDEGMGGSRKRKKPRSKSLRRVVGENAADKARIPVQSQARAVVEDIVAGKPPKPAAQKLASLGLTPAEKRDVQSFSRVRSEQVQDARDPQEQIAAQLIGPNLAKLLPGGSPANEAFDSPEWLALEVAGIFPFGRAVRGGAQAASKVGKAAPEGADKITESLPEARRVRAKQQAGYSVERGRRVGAADDAYEQAGGGQAGHLAGKAELAGELPKLPFDRLMKEFGEADSVKRQFFQPQVDEMLDFITAHPSFAGRSLSALSAREGLLKALDGVTPQKSEIRLLEQVFGDEAVQHFKWRIVRDKTLKALNLPRALTASYDLSRAFRQDIAMAARHPRMWAKNWRPMLQAAKDPVKAQAILDEIRARPRFDEYQDVGLKVTDFRSPKTIEEDFIGAEYAERIPFVGAGVRFSSRAYTVGGAKLRADVYDMLVDQHEAAGRLLTKREKRDLASFINAATGRGNMGFDALEKAAPFLTAGLFSPRLIASRVAFLNPYWYAKLSGPARRQAMESMAAFVAAGSAVLWMADQIPGVDVGLDPRSSNFGKIRVGDTRIDIWGGFQQYVVNGSRYIKGETKSSTTGEVSSKSREDILWQFASGKAAPIPGFVRDFNRGSGFDGQPFDPVKAFGKLFVPLNVQSTYGAKDDPKVAAATFGLGALGFGVLNYPDDEKKAPGSTRRSKSLRGEGGGRKRSKSLRRRS